MKFDDKGVYIPIEGEKAVKVPWRAYNRILDGIKETRKRIDEIPRVLRWAIKKAMVNIDDEEYAVNSLAQIITSVKIAGGRIVWKK